MSAVVRDALQAMRPPKLTATDHALNSAYAKLRWPPQHRFTPEESQALLALLELHQRGEVKLAAQPKARSR